MSSRSPATPASDYPHPPTFLEIDGERVAVVDRGDGPALVLVPGLGADISDFARVFDALARDHRVIALDLPGFGASSRPVDRISISYYVDVLDQVLREIDADDVVLVGTSMGGQIALSWFTEARARPRVRGLVIADCGGTFEAVDGQRELAERFNRADVLLGRSRDRHRWQLRHLFHDPGPFLEAYVDHRLAILESVEGPDYARCIERAVSAVYDELVDARDLEGIPVPVLVLWGEGDRVIGPEEGRRLADHLADARFEAIPDCGHLPWLETPQVFATAVRSFVGALPAGLPTRDPS